MDAFGPGYKGLTVFPLRFSYKISWSSIVGKN